VLTSVDDFLFENQWRGYRNLSRRTD